MMKFYISNNHHTPMIQRRRQWKSPSSLSIIIIAVLLLLLSSFTLTSAAQNNDERIHLRLHQQQHPVSRNTQTTNNNNNCIEVSIFLDEYPEDTSWKIFDATPGTVNDVEQQLPLATSPPYDKSMALTQQTSQICTLPTPGIYSFIIYDAYSDGMCCKWGNGRYTVTDSSNNGEILASGGEWSGPSESTLFVLDGPTTFYQEEEETVSNVVGGVPTLAPTLKMGSSILYDDDATPKNITTQVNIYLTGVPPNNSNNNNNIMTNEELSVFESLLFNLTSSRLQTVNITIFEVAVDEQIYNPQYYDFDVMQSPFETTTTTTTGGGGGEESSSVLQLITNITFSYTPPPPEGYRDPSIYLTRWIESFGMTMVDIFTNTKHPLYNPNVEYFKSIIDVSATNVVPPNTDPTMSPTMSPTYLGAPEYKQPLVIGLASSGVIIVVVFFVVAFWMKQQKRRIQRTHNNDDILSEQTEKKKFNGEEGRGGGKSPLGYDYDDDDDILLRSSPSQRRVSRGSSKNVIVSRGSSYNNNNNNININSTRSSSTTRPVMNRMFDANYTMEEMSVNNDDNSENNTSQQSRGGGGGGVTWQDNITTAPTPPPTRHIHQNAAAVVAATTVMQQQKSHPQHLVQQSYDGIVDDVMANNPNLTKVVLDNQRQIGGVTNNDGGEALWQALTTNKYVTLLSLQNSNITDDIIAALALALSDNSSITHLLLQNNHITSEGVEYLIVCLECNSTIEVIALEGNTFIDPAIHDELKEVLLSRGGGKGDCRDDENGVSNNNSARLDKILDRVRHNDPRLTDLDLQNMDIGLNDIGRIVDAMSKNSHLQNVNLSRNMIDDDGVSTLSLALAENTLLSITHLSLANNRITSIGAEYMLCSLENNATILDVDLSGNSIDHEVLAELDYALKQRRA